MKKCCVCGREHLNVSSAQSWLLGIGQYVGTWLALKFRDLFLALPLLSVFLCLAFCSLLPLLSPPPSFSSVFLLYSHATVTLTTCVTPAGCPTTQFHSDTITRRELQIPQVEGSVLQDCLLSPYPHLYFRCQLGVQVVPCASDQL